jgi:agmatine/peptidylarginine deiminase
LLESFDLKQKSKQLLEIAKIGVEKAIETDEATATEASSVNFLLYNIYIYFP